MDQFERGTLKLVLSAGINYKLAVAGPGGGVVQAAAGAGHVDSVWAAAGGWWQGNT